MNTNKLDDFDAEVVKRPTFLTVLCILTFIGSGWSILSSVWAYTQAEKMSQIAQIRDQNWARDSLSQKDSARLEQEKKSESYMIGKKIGDSARKMLTVDNIHKKSIGDLIAGLFTLGGAILMWFQNKKGFYLYIVGVIIGIFVPFYLYGDDLITVGIVSFGAFFGLLFIALYALNLKSMTSNRLEK